MLALKLSLVALSMLSATWAARHFGHRAGGLIAGFPLIMAPLIGLLLIDLTGLRVADILWTTLANFTACVGFIVAMGLAVIRFNWWQSLLIASAAFFVLTAITTMLPVPRMVTVAMGLLSILVGPWLIPAGTPPAGGVKVPASEFFCRMVAALAMAASVLLLAADTPPLVSAMLLTYPINGSVLPAFTRALYGGPAARSVLTGFGVGLRGVGVFMVATALGLETLDNRWLGYALGVGCAVAYAVWLWIPKRSRQTVSR
jgi:hypothetical protein